MDMMIMEIDMIDFKEEWSDLPHLAYEKEKSKL